MTKRYISLLSILPLVLGGCAVGPDYKAHEIQSPEAWRIAIPADAPSAANIAWWEIFQDEPDLLALIQAGLEHNKEIKIALARMEQSRAALGVSVAEFLPSVGYSGTAYHNDPKSFQFSNPHGYTLGGNVAWELDLWGRVRRLNESAKAAYFATAESKNAVVLSLVSSIATSYFTLRMLDEQVAISEQTAKTRQEAAQIAKDRLAQGVGNGIDALQFESDAIAAKAAIVSFKNAVTLQENALSVLVGRNPGTISRARKPAARVAGANYKPVPIPAGLPADLLRNRPDVRIAERNVCAANAQIGAAVANYFPRISLTAALGFVSPQIKHLLDNSHMGAQGGGNFLGPIFDGGATYYSVKGAEARTKEAVLAYEQTALNAFREVNDALSTLQAERERLALLKEQVAKLTDVLEKNRAAYNIGKLALLPVLDADRNLFSVKLALIDAQTSELTTAVWLYKALGGGWRTKDGVVVAQPGKQDIQSPFRKDSPPLKNAQGQVADGPGQPAGKDKGK